MDHEQHSAAEAKPGEASVSAKHVNRKVAGVLALAGGAAGTGYAAVAGVDPVTVAMGGSSALIAAGLAFGHLLKRASIHMLVHSVAGAVKQAQTDRDRLLLVKEAAALAEKLDRRT